MEEVPDGKPYILLKLGAQRKRGEKSFTYNGPPISYPVEALFEVCEDEGDKKGTVKYHISKTFDNDIVGKKIGMILSKLASIELRKYSLHVKLTDKDGIIFKNKHSLVLTDDGRIKNDSLEQHRTLFLYQWVNDKFVSYSETVPGNFVHDNDHSVEFDGDQDYELYIGNQTKPDENAGATKVESISKSS